MLPQQSSTSRRLACSRWRNSCNLRRQILQLIILSISCASIFANTEHTQQQHNQKQRTQRRMQVAPLNTYLLVKDEFDKHRSDIESFVFQTLDAFATPIKEDNDPTTFIDQSSNGIGTKPSRLYTYNAFFESLRSLCVDGILGNSYHSLKNPYYNVGTGSQSGNSGSNEFVNDNENMAFYISQNHDQQQGGSADSSGTNQSRDNSLKYAIVNICAFLANAMVESIQYDACEEFNGMVSGLEYDKLMKNTQSAAASSNGSEEGNDGLNGILSELNGVNGRYFPISNACGQFGRSYQEEQCYDVPTTGSSSGNSDIDMSFACPANPNLSMTAATHSKYNYQQSNTARTSDQPPPPFYCGKKQVEDGYSGMWDGYSIEFIQKVAYPSTAGRIDTEACCFWGRGMLMTKSTCGLGRINHYMGKAAYNDNRPSRYPNINFCQFPSIICGVTNAQLNGATYPELRYVVALFHWIDRVQSYSSSSWTYMDELKSFVDNGMKDTDGSFIDTVSSVLTRGCDGYYCSMQSIHFLEERRRNFNILIHDIFNLEGNFAMPEQPQPKFDFDYAMRWLHKMRSRIEGNIFVSKNAALDGVSYFSQAYRYEPFLSALRTTGYFGVGEQRFFFISDEKKGLRGFNAGLANLAFFFANVMAESIANDSCNEAHWDSKDGGQSYAIANSCGQNGRDYGTETCPPWQSFMTCAVDTSAEMQAELPRTLKPPFVIETQPPPFQCKPGTAPAGSWDATTQTLNNNDPTFSNSYGRTDIQGCCFYGRGAMLTRGSCNYGKLNFHLGAQAAEDNRPAIYPKVNFCTEPDAICTSDESMEMRWVVGMFEWIDRVQDYYDSTEEWSYQDELYKFVDGGYDDDMFIDAVSNIAARGCHKPSGLSCSGVGSVETNRFLYGLERRMHFKNIIRLVFELPVSPALDRPWKDSSNSSTPPPPPPASPGQPQVWQRPTFKPTFRPTPYPVASLTTNKPIATTPRTPRPTGDGRPTGSPIEFSDITIYNDGSTVVINNEATSFTDESIVVTKNTTLMLEEGGYIEAPLNTDWPAIRVSIASALIGRGGIVNGSFADTAFIEGDYEDGGEGIHVNNGQSSPETASRAEFYEGIQVLGGDAPSGIGGNALHVNGFGTETYIYGGSFIGGKGMRGNGLSLYVLNSAMVHVRGGSFVGDMKAERRGVIAFYGCFMRNGTQVTGNFEDESELDVTIRTYYGGEVLLIPLAEQECETAPSTAPTNFPTITHIPTVPRPNDSSMRRVGISLIIVAAYVVLSVL